MNSISAVQLNYIIYRYLMASGFVHTAFNFKYESGINNLPIDGDSVPHTTLIELVQTGLLFKEMQQANAANNADDEEFCFLPITDLITKNVSELQKIVKGKEVNPSATEPKDLAKKGNPSASELGNPSASQSDNTQDPEDELLGVGQVNDSISSYQIYTSGTGIAGYVGSDFIALAGDGRTVKLDKLEKYTVLCEGDDRKIRIIQDDIVVGIAGTKQLGDIFLAKVIRKLDSGKKRGNRTVKSFADICNLQAEADRIGINSEFDILCLGYLQGQAYVYSINTRKCRVAKVGSIQGIGSAFGTIKNHFKKLIKNFEGDEVLEVNAVVSMLKSSFCVGTIFDNSCGGTVNIAVLRKGEVAELRNEGHILKIMCSLADDMKDVLKLCVLVAVRGRFYTEEEHKVGLQNIRERFPLLKKVNIIGVVRSKSKKCETIISMVSFDCESDMHRVVAYGEERLDEGVWLKIERPTRAVLNKYAKKIAKNSFF